MKNPNIRKLSADMDKEVYASLEQMANCLNMKNGPFLNLLVKTIGSLSKEMKKAIIATCLNRISTLEEEQKDADEFFSSRIDEEINQIQLFAEVINDGNGIETLNKDMTKPIMKQIRLANGNLVIPEEFIVLNPELAKEAHNAGVVAVKGKNDEIPYFVYLEKDNELSESEILQMCVSKYPDFQNVIDEQIEPIPDTDHPGSFKNAKEVSNSPIIACFGLLDAGMDPNGDENRPFGAMIYRD